MTPQVANERANQSLTLEHVIRGCETAQTL